MAQPCPLHKTELQDGRKHIHYGFITGTFDYFDASKKRFPRANVISFRGCSPRPRKTRKARFCGACREGLLAWCHEKVDELGGTSIFVQALLECLAAEGFA